MIARGIDWLRRWLLRYACWLFGHHWAFVVTEIPSGKQYQECLFCTARRPVP